MATTSSGSSALSGLRLSGTSLMSGLDTESIVKQMASATKNRINKQQQQLDSLSWKQTDYRGIITKLQNFQNNYFNSLKPSTNLSSSTLMNAYKATSSNANVTATGSPKSSATSYSITSVQMAKTAEYASSFADGTLTDGIKVDFSAFSGDQFATTDYTVQVTLDGNAKQISFKGGADVQQNFLDALKDTANFGATEGAKFSVADGKLKYTNASGDTIFHSFSIAATTNTLDSNSTKNANLKAMALNAVGVPNGGANKITTGMKLAEVGFSTALKGGSYSFTINGENFTFDSTATVGQVINKINSSSKANVTLSFDSLSQKFTMKSDNEGSASSISMTQTGGNLLSVLFGSDIIAEGNTIDSSVLIPRSITGTALSATDFTDLKGSQISVTVNGQSKDVWLWGYDNNGVAYDFKDTTDSKGEVTTGASKAVSALNTELTRLFGTNAPSFAYDKYTKQISLKAAATGDIVSVASISGNAESSALMSKLGFTSGATNAITGSTKLSSLIGTFADTTLQIGATSASVTANTTLDELKAAFGSDIDINLEKGVINAKAQLTSADSTGKMLIAALFGGTYDSIHTASGSLPATAGESAAAIGSNSIVTINGTSISNSTNVITIDGTTINLGNMTAADLASVNGGTPITITTSRDTSSIKDVILKFVDEYNTLIGDLNTAITTKRPTDDGTLSGTKYDPLTEEQREDMKEDAIKKWEEKAKTGLLYNDNESLNVMTKLRGAMNTRSASNFTLMDLGISASTAYKDNGKLVIKDEAALEANIIKYADQAKELFTDTENGLAANINKALNSAISTSRTTGYGSLVRCAGIENTVSGSDNEISRRVTEYQTTIKALKTRYSSELQRYWNKFTQLETMTAKYSSYSSMFTSATS